MPTYLRCLDGPEEYPSCTPVSGPSNFVHQRRPSSTIIVKTFNNGSLGSGIDEERSEMR